MIMSKISTVLLIVLVSFLVAVPDANASHRTDSNSLSAKTLKACAKDEKKLTKELEKIAKAAERKNMSEKVFTKLQKKESAVLARIEKHDKKCTSLDSVRITDVFIGSGAVATAGKVITVSYTGTLPDGTVFDTTSRRSAPDNLFTFILGAGHVIKGWERGIVGMKVGGKRQLVIPPGHAYGLRGIPGTIPANTTITFDIELLGVK